MDNQTISFATLTENKVVTKIGRSTILQTKPRCKKNFTKWFDDTRLLKSNKA